MDNEFSPLSTTITCYRPAGQRELDLIANSEYQRWPCRQPNQPIFDPVVTNEEYALELTQWHSDTAGIGYLTKFDMSLDYISRQKFKSVDDKVHSEWWVGPQELEEFNNNIIGKIEVIEEIPRH